MACTADAAASAGSGGMRSERLRWRTRRVIGRSRVAECVKSQLPIPNSQSTPNAQLPISRVGSLGRWELGVDWGLGVGDWELTRFQSDVAVAGADLEGLAPVADFASQRAAARVAAVGRDLQIAADRSVAGMRVELGVEVGRQVDRNPAVARGHRPV